MIGTKNIWVNILLIIGVIVGLYVIYSVLKDNRNNLVMGGITIGVCITGIVIAFLNRVDDKRMKEMSSKATKDELLVVDKKIDQHIVENNVSFQNLYNLHQKLSDKIDFNNNLFHEKLEKILERIPNKKQN